MPFIKKLVVMATLPLPNAVRWRLLPWISRRCLSSPFAAHMLENVGVKDTTAYYESLARQANLVDAFTAQVCPRQAGVAGRRAGREKELTLAYLKSER